MLTIDDAHLPGLADLSQKRLRDITGAQEVDLLRLRYRPGKRAILHVATRTTRTGPKGRFGFSAVRRAGGSPDATGRSLSMIRKLEPSLRLFPRITGCPRSAVFWSALRRSCP